VTSLPPCTVATPQDVKEQRLEAKAEATRADAQRSADAYTKNTVERSSCLTDVGPTVPLKPGECVAYGQAN
jgi:hypothetical protein